MTPVRRHTAADTAALIALAERLAIMHLALDPRRFNWTANLHAAYRDWFNAALTNRDRVVYVAEREGVIVGYTMAEAIPEDTAMWSPAHAFIHDIQVDEGARHRGIAQSLVDAVVDWARARGIVQVRALTAIANNPAADFFTRRGFRPAATERVLDLDS